MNRINMLNAAISASVLAFGLGAYLLEAAERSDLREQFRRYDSDGSGEVTATELTDPKVFALLDRDGNGAITLDEVSHAVEAGRLRGVRLPDPVPPAKQSAYEPVAATGKSTPQESDAMEAIRQGPKPIKASQHGVGRRIADLHFTDIDGGRHTLSEFNDCKVLVIAMTGIGCPLCQKYCADLSGHRRSLSGSRRDLPFPQSQ